MEAKLSEYIRNHPIVILGGCVLFGMLFAGTITMGTLRFIGLEIVLPSDVIPKETIKEKYVEVAEYNRIEKHLQIILERDRRTDLKEILALHNGFRQIDLSLDKSKFLDTYIVESYNFHADRFNKFFPSSTLPVFESPPMDRPIIGVKGMQPTVKLALSIIDGKYWV